MIPKLDTRFTYGDKVFDKNNFAAASNYFAAADR